MLRQGVLRRLRLRAARVRVLRRGADQSARAHRRRARRRGAFFRERGRGEEREPERKPAGSAGPGGGRGERAAAAFGGGARVASRGSRPPRRGGGGGARVANDASRGRRALDRGRTRRRRFRLSGLAFGLGGDGIVERGGGERAAAAAAGGAEGPGASPGLSPAAGTKARGIMEYLVALRAKHREAREARAAAERSAASAARSKPVVRGHRASLTGAGANAASLAAVAKGTQLRRGIRSSDAALCAAASARLVAGGGSRVGGSGSGGVEAARDRGRRRFFSFVLVRREGAIRLTAAGEGDRVLAVDGDA